MRRLKGSEDAISMSVVDPVRDERGWAFREGRRLDRRLQGRRFLVGDRRTEADRRLFTTRIRFDAVYVGHFKCNLRRIVDHPALWPYLRDLYQAPGVAETADSDHIRRHCYVTRDSINPTGIVPEGPALDLSLPHGRG